MIKPIEKLMPETKSFLNSFINSRNESFSIFTFNICVLYTSVHQHKLRSVIGELMNFCLNGGDKDFIVISRYGAI